MLDQLPKGITLMALLVLMSFNACFGVAQQLPPLPDIQPPPTRKQPVKTIVGNFRVDAPTEKVRQLIEKCAEKTRKECAMLWLGKELPQWKIPCPLKVELTPDKDSNGATSFGFGPEGVLTRQMHVKGNLEDLLKSVVPHEVAHAIMADYYQRPVPRWADEGIAVLSEDSVFRKDYPKKLKVLTVNGRLIPLRRLMEMREYPHNVHSFFVQSTSVTQFLLKKKDRKTFLTFVKSGMETNWDKAVKNQYGYANVEQLEEVWLKSQSPTARPAIDKRRRVRETNPKGQQSPLVQVRVELLSPIPKPHPRIESLVLLPRSPTAMPELIELRAELRKLRRQIQLLSRKLSKSDRSGKR
ncbi:MAG: hypothetical protein ACFCD0_09410 [Gemmataceae bacterium]